MEIIKHNAARDFSLKPQLIRNALRDNADAGDNDDDDGNDNENDNERPVSTSLLIVLILNIFFSFKVNKWII